MSDVNKPAPRRSRRRTCCFGLVIAALLGVLALVAAIAWFYEHPLSNNALHARVLQRLERISGMPAKYDSAKLVLATGRYHITNLRFIDPAQPDRPVFTIGEVYAQIKPWEILTDPESQITDVVLKDPSPFEFIYTHNSIKLGEKSKFLLNAVKNAQPPGSNVDEQLPFDELKLENAHFYFVESEGILPDLAPSTATLQLAGDVTVKDKDDTLYLDFTGLAGEGEVLQQTANTSATRAAGVNISVAFEPDNKVALNGKIKRVALHRIFREMPKTWLKAGDISFDLTTEATAGGRHIRGDINAATINLNNPENALSLDDEMLAFKTDMDLQTSAGIVNFRNLSLNSDGAHFDLAGTASYGAFPPEHARLSLNVGRMDKDYRVMLERLLPAGWDVTAQDDSIAMNLQTTIQHGKLDSLNGSMNLHNVAVKSPILPTQIENLTGQMHFSDSEIIFADMTGDYAGARIALDGALKGDPWQTRTGELDMNWSAIVELAQVIQYHQQQLPSASNDITASGRVAGHGTWKQSINLGPEASSVPRIEGGFDFENVSLDHPLLPAPVSSLNGSAVIQDDTLQVENLTGKLRDNEMHVDGFVQGNDFFWRDSQVSASLTSRMDLAQIGSYLPAQTGETLEKYNLSGEAVTRMELSGPVFDLGSHFTGRMELSDVGFSPGLEFMQGNVSDLSGVIRWNGSRINLDALDGKIDNEPVDLGGSISANHIDLHVSTKAPLEAVERIFPKLDKYLDMSGGLETDLQFSAGSDTPAPLSSIPEVLEQARALLDASVSQHTFSLNGRLRLNDAQMRHIAMPVARTENGRKIPEGRVTDMNGVITITGDTLRVSNDNPITCRFSDTPDCRVSGWLKLRPDNFPEMNVTINTRSTLRLDTWIMGWGKALPRPDTPPITGKKFDLEASIRAPRITVRGQQGGLSSGKVSFHMTQDDTPRVTRFNDIVVQGLQAGTGRVIGGGRIDSFVWDKTRFPHWQTTVDAQAMPLETMLGAVFVQPTNLRGLSSGRIELEGIGGDSRSIRGNGSAHVTNLEIGRTAVIQELGQTTGRNFGGMLFETARAATFQVGNGALSSRDIALQANGLQLEMHGDYWFAGDPARGIPPKAIDGSLRLKLFKSVFGSIPIIGQVADLADEVTNAFLLAFRVTGTADNPRVTPVALPVFQGGL